MQVPQAIEQAQRGPLAEALAGLGAEHVGQHEPFVADQFIKAGRGLDGLAPAGAVHRLGRMVIVGSVPVREAGIAMQAEPATHLPQHLRVLAHADAGRPRLDPGIDATPCRIDRRARRPAGQARFGGHLSGHGHQCEATADALHLAAGQLGNEPRFGRFHALAQRACQPVGALGQVLQPGAARRAEGDFGGACQLLRQRAAAVEFVQLFEGAAPGAGIGRKVDHAQFLPGPRALVGLAHVLGEADFSGAQEQQAPVQARTCRARAAGAALALPVGEHVGAFAGHLGIELRQLVQTQ